MQAKSATRETARGGIVAHERNEDLGYALRWFFGSREEMNEMFRELEAKMIEDMRRICEEAKRKREAEWPIPSEDDADSRSALPVVAPHGAQVIEASTQEALKTEEADVDKVSR